MKVEIKKAILEMLSDEATATDLCGTGDYKTTLFANGLRAIIVTWLDNGCAEPVWQMNEIVMREYRKLWG